jgi:hypothetical protein
MSESSFRDTEKAYGGLRTYEKAKATGQTKLDYRQWVQVRTPEFKNWFGDWEAAQGARKLNAMTPLTLDDLQPAMDQKAVEALFKNFGPVENKSDGRFVTFPVGMAGKIVRHKGFDVKRVARAFDLLFVDAVPMFSELEKTKAGHKAHPEIEAYHHYVSKFEQNGKGYYIRFTVQQMRAAPRKVKSSFVHSSFISEVSIYEKGASSAGGRGSNPVLTEQSAPLDSKLAQWIEKGKEPISQMIDLDTGEPHSF